MRQLRGRTLRLLKIGCFCFIFMIVVWYIAMTLKKRVTPMYASGVVDTTVGHIRYDFSTGMFSLIENGETYVQGLLSETLRYTAALECRPDRNNPNYLCLRWHRYTDLEVRKLKGSDQCHEITWKPSSRDFLPQDCISLRGAIWYGGGEMYDQKWPLRDVSIPLQPYLPNDLMYKTKYNKPAGNIFGNVIERFWLSTKGVGIVVDSSVPLFVSMNTSNSNLLCFTTSSDHPRYPAGQSHVLKYTICKKKNIKEVYELMQKRHFESPKDKPSLDLMQFPVLSTIPKFENNMTQGALLKFVKKFKDDIQKALSIKKLFFEFDGLFSSKFGNFDIDSGLFPNAHQVCSTLREYGYQIIVSMTPLISKDSKNFDTKTEFLVQNSNSEQLALVKWYYGMVGIVDVTNPDAARWFHSKLSTMMKEYGIDGLKLYACESNYLPPNHLSHGSLTNPGSYVTNLLSLVSNLGQDKQLLQTTCAYKSQKHSMYIQLGRKESKWGEDNGLQSVIPAVLTLGILGYPFVIPDVVGGSGSHGNTTSPPNRELYIRWLQIAVFMPVLKFSYVPWDYDDKVVDIAFKLMKRRQEIMRLLINAAKEAETNGSPIIRPLWWIDPLDPYALTANSEFMLGNDLLVAPVVHPGVTKIDIYLPEGHWKDNLKGQVHQGKHWLRDYEVTLEQIPTFSKHKFLAK
ncbi:myogenesis-regulating glycosidase-like [Saccostrea cucullata]|uniref:myogenesis-regulating glycosidase-like n=1 Tax=Saccostrea cuccullata TaxID=36930 RepID=UPI002ED3628C